MFGSPANVRTITLDPSLAGVIIELAAKELREKTMPESILTEPIKSEVEISKAAPGSPTKRSSKAFNSFQIAQAQFDKVAEYLGLDAATRISCGILARVPVCHSSAHGRRDGEDFPRFPGAAQRCSRTGQGWHSLPPAGDDRYRSRPIHVDDMEMRRGRYSARRSEGRSDLRSA